MKKHLEITEENINSKSNLVVSPTTYTINNEDLVIRFTVTGTVSNGQILINGNYIYAKSFTQNTITFNNLDFGVGSNDIQRLALIVNGTWAMWDNGITVIKNNEVIPPTDNPPTISTIADISAKVNESISIAYNAIDDNAITKHELSQNGGSSYSQINPTKNGNTYTHRITYSSVGNRQCKIKVSDVKGQGVVSNNFTISVTEDTVDPPPTENRPPTISGISVSSITSSGSYKLDYTINDVDNDKMTVELKVGSQAYKVIASNQGDGAKVYNGYGLAQGNHTCYLKVGDGKLFTTSNSFSINVTGGSSSGLQAKWEAYTSTLQALREAMHNATVKIAQVKADDIKTQLDKDIADLNDALEGLDDILNGAFEDGILSDAEKLVIKQQLQTISKEKGDVDKQYETIYNNVDLIGVAKTNFKSAYDTYNTKYLNLVSVINEIVNKVGLVDATDQTRLNNAFNEYKIASGNYSKRANEAIDAIADKKADDAESNANKHTEARIKVVKDEINLKVSQIEYNSNKEIVNNKFTEIKQTTDDITSTVSKKVGVEEVKSVIEQNPECVRVSFDKISNDVVTISPMGLRVWHEGRGFTLFSHDEIYQTDITAGRKLISLKDGGFRCYKDDADNSYIGGFKTVARNINFHHKAFGMSLANGNRSWFSSFSHNPDVFETKDESLTGFKHYLMTVYAQFLNSENGKTYKIGTHVLEGGLFLNGNNISLEDGKILFSNSHNDAIYKNPNDNSTTVQCEKRIRLIQNSSTGSIWNGIDIDFNLSKIRSDLEWDFGGQYLKNGLWAGSYVSSDEIVAINNFETQSILDTVDVIKCKNDKLGLCKINDTSDIVTSSRDAMLNSNEFEYSQLILSLVKEIKELKKEVENLKTKS